MSKLTDLVPGKEWTGVDKVAVSQRTMELGLLNIDGASPCPVSKLPYDQSERCEDVISWTTLCTAYNEYFIHGALHF